MHLASSSTALAVTPRNAYRARVAQLSARSVTKHFDAYGDIAWDRPDHRVDPEDPRWEKPRTDVLGATEWYQRQPASIRARIGLHHMVEQMKTGIDFEAVLARGLLQFASALPTGAPEFRYAYHELIEEGQHSLMFNEFIQRAGLPVRGLRGFEAAVARIVPRFGRTFPELFFLFVLAGEAPIDHVQRQALTNRGAHPLLRRIMQIHVTEEARHLCFAKSYLLEHAPSLGSFRRLQLRVRTPFILSAMAREMLKPPAHLIYTYRIPRSVVRDAYENNPTHRAQMLESVEPVRGLCHEIGLITPAFAKLWQALGIAPKSPEPPRRLPVPGVIRAVPVKWYRSPGSQG